MSKYAVYEIFGDSAPYNVEFCGHLAGVKVGTSDKNPLDISDQRRYYERMMDEIDAVYRRQIDQLQAENAKLRELVRIAGTYCVNGLCGKDDGCTLYLGKPYCALPDRMRDLGIEVDE